MQRVMFHSLDCDHARARSSLLVLSAFFVAHFADFEHVALIDLVQQFPKPRIPKQSMECLHARKRTVRDLRYIAREMTLVLPNVGRYDQYAFLADGTAIRMSDTSSIDKQEWVMTDETKTILGYRCKKAQTTINSNTIVLWYTDELPYHAAPSILGQRLGVVLEQVRNGNFAITARDISKIKLIII